MASVEKRCPYHQENWEGLSPASGTEVKDPILETGVLLHPMSSGFRSSLIGMGKVQRSMLYFLM
jgi:hypothetical protein